MEDIKVTGRIDFCEDTKGYSRTFTATLTESGAFAYGNRTAVVVEWGQMVNGVTPEPRLLDTRYDTTIRKNEKDFKSWIREWFKENYQEHTLTID